jgi:hypothetical protein
MGLTADGADKGGGAAAVQEDVARRAILRGDEIDSIAAVSDEAAVGVDRGAIRVAIARLRGSAADQCVAIVGHLAKQDVGEAGGGLTGHQVAGRADVRDVVALGAEDRLRRRGVAAGQHGERVRPARQGAGAGDEGVAGARGGERRPTASGSGPGRAWPARTAAAPARRRRAPRATRGRPAARRSRPAGRPRPGRPGRSPPASGARPGPGASGRGGPWGR